jgi:mitochondrial protein import protein ZIM17
MLMAYTCGKCEHKQARTFSKHSYEQGVVLIRCENCDSLHLIADNLGWFEDKNVNIEQIMQRKGENVITNITDDGIEITRPKIADKHGAADFNEEAFQD